MNGRSGGRAPAAPAAAAAHRRGDAERAAERAAEQTAEQTAGRVVLLDRDGTIVVDREYLADPAGLEFLPGAAAGLRRLHRGGHRLVVISNQSGVGRGLFSLMQLQAVNERLAAMVREIGAELAGIYCCPHRPEDACACRKPGIGLVRQAAAELGFDPAAAVVIGDKPSDVELGRRLGAVTIRIAAQGAPAVNPQAGAAPPGHLTGEPVHLTGEPAHPGGGGCTANHVAANLVQAAQIIETL